MKVYDFIKKEWTEFANGDNISNLPHLMDGLKPSQRKILHTFFEVFKTNFVKVSQSASRTSEFTHYEHGETSLENAIISMTKDFTGENNFPFLKGDGQFGTQQYKEASSPRYIFVSLNEKVYEIFNTDEFNIINYLYYDGDRIEPEFYLPNIPTILLNGASGVGNGFRSNIAMYDIEDVKQAINEFKRYNKVTTPLIPHLNGFKGSITKEDKQIVYTGIFERINTTTITITELPPEYDSEKYKGVLNKLVDDKVITGYTNNSVEGEWSFEIKCPRALTAMSDEKLLSVLKLQQKMTENIVCWLPDKPVPHTFDTIEQLIESWCEYRLKYYDDYINYKIPNLDSKRVELDQIKVFCEWALNGGIDELKGLTRKQLESKVKSLGVTDDKIVSKCVGLPIYNLSKDYISKLDKDLKAVAKELDTWKKTTNKDLL